MNGDTTVAIARLDERLKGIVREVERNEQSAQRALELSAAELSRRLEILNGEREREAATRNTFVTRELHDSGFAVVEKRLSALEGRSWILYVAAAGAVAAIVAEAARLVFKVG